MTPQLYAIAPNYAGFPRWWEMSAATVAVGVAEVEVAEVRGMVRRTMS